MDRARRELRHATRRLRRAPGFTTVAVLTLAVGLGLALLLTRFLRGMLFGVTATDPWSFATTAALLLGVGLLAAWLPARRAARVDPSLALKDAACWTE